MKFSKYFDFSSWINQLQTSLTDCYDEMKVSRFSNSDEETAEFAADNLVIGFNRDKWTHWYFNPHQTKEKEKLTTLEKPGKFHGFPVWTSR